MPHPIMARPYMTLDLAGPSIWSCPGPTVSMVVFGLSTFKILDSQVEFPVIAGKTPAGLLINYNLKSFLTYYRLCGFPPFYHDNNAKLFDMIQRGDFEFPSPYWDEISD
jgi:hypothetical protein